MESNKLQAATLRAGHGYYDCTVHPIGGLFCRSPYPGPPMAITEITQLRGRYQGCTHKGKCNGRDIAFDMAHTLEGRAERDAIVDAIDRANEESDRADERAIYGGPEL